MCTQYVHGRGRMTIDPRIHVAFSPTRRGGGCTRFVHGGGGRTHLLLDLVTSTIDHVFLSKRSDIPTPVKDTSNSLRAHYVFFFIPVSANKYKLDVNK